MGAATANKLRYLLDANIYIQARQRWYRFAVCPGYWDALAWHKQDGSLCSIDRVEAELHDKELKEWIKLSNLKDSFRATDHQEVVATYSEIMTWAVNSGRYTEGAIAELAGNADGWLVAFAKVHELKVVTLEEPDPHSKKRVKIPDLCQKFDVEYCKPFEMLEELGIQLTWSPPAQYKIDSSDVPRVLERLTI